MRLFVVVSRQLLAIARRRICQMFYTSKIPNFVNLIRKTRVNSDIFGNKLKMEDVLLLCLVQIVGVRRRLSVFVQLC